MDAWAGNASAHLLHFIQLTWSDTPSPVKTIFVAAFGTLIGALLTSRAQAKRRLVEELRAIHAAYTICFSITNKALVIKRQHVRPMKIKYEADVSTYDNWMEKAESHLNLDIDFRALPRLQFANAALERTVFEKCSLGHMGLAAMLSLGDAANALNSSIDYRNNLVTEFQKNPRATREEKITFYVGTYQDGEVDQRFANNIDNLAHQTDECIFFGMLLSNELYNLERKLRSRNWWKFRLEVPRQFPADWTLARNEKLIPERSQYADWLQGFKKPPSIWTRFGNFLSRLLWWRRV